MSVKLYELGKNVRVSTANLVRGNCCLCGQRSVGFFMKINSPISKKGRFYFCYLCMGKLTKQFDDKLLTVNMPKEKWDRMTGESMDMTFHDEYEKTGAKNDGQGTLLPSGLAEAESGKPGVQAGHAGDGACPGGLDTQEQERQASGVGAKRGKPKSKRSGKRTNKTTGGKS